MKKSLIILIILLGSIVTAADLQIGDKIGENIKPEDIVISQNIKFIRQNTETTLTFAADGSYVKVKNDMFNNIKKQDANTNAYIKLNDNGELTEADITSDKNGGVYAFGNEIVKVPPSTRVTYKNGEINVYGKDKTFQLTHKDDTTTQPNAIKILDPSGVTIKGNTITGKSFDTNGIWVSSSKEGGEGKGEVTFTGSKVTKVGKDTSATIKGVEHDTFSSELNLYYDENFDPSKHKGENYFNYGKNKVFIGGDNFASIFREKNDVFPELKLEKQIQGAQPKIGFFGIEMRNGDVEVAKDTSKKDLYFNVKSEGDFMLIQGRHKVVAEGGGVYIQPYKEYELSYGMNINNEYFSDGFTVKDRKGDVTFDTTLPWERTIQKASNIDKSQTDQIKQAIKKQLNVNPKVYHGFINEETEEDLAKWTYEAAEKANKNQYGVKVTPYEVFTTFMAEGGADPNLIMKYYYKNHYEYVFAFSDLGLDYIAREMPILKQQGFVPGDVTLTPTTAQNEHGVIVPTANFPDLSQGLTALAGRLAWTKKAFLDDFKNYYGEEELNKMSDDEKFFWTTYYYNCGNNCGKGELTGMTYTNGRGVKVQGAGRAKVYKQWDAPIVSSNTNPRYNSLERLSSMKLLQGLKLFDTP